MTQRTTAFAAFVAGAVALLTACSGGSSGGLSDASRADTVAGGAASASSAAGPARDGAAPAQQAARVASSSLVITGRVSLSVDTNAAVGTAAARATAIADSADGRVDADSRTTATRADERPTATLVLRVPNAALPVVNRQLAALGTVRSQDVQTKDVTTQVADVDSRVTSARAAIAGLTRLYARANSVRDLITVESALTARQSDLEALESEQRTLSAQTSLATLTLEIAVRHTPVPVHHTHRGGFTGGLHNGWDAFTTTVGAIATAAGAVLPFAVLILLAGGAGLLLRGRRRPNPSA